MSIMPKKTDYAGKPESRLSAILEARIAAAIRGSDS
jgi:hypothetical protein